MSTPKIRVTIAEPFLRAAQEELDAHPDRLLHREAGVRRWNDGLELLLPTRPRSESNAAAVRLFRIPPRLQGASHLYWAVHERRFHARMTLELALREDAGCSAALLDGHEVHPVESVRPAGRWMESWTPARGIGERIGKIPADGPHSRYVGALGGSAIHERLCALSVALVGSARLGSGLAVSFARAGVKELTLIDPDTLESHSLDAVECLPEDLGRPKAEALAAHCKRIAPDIRVRALALPVEHADAFAACAGSDLIVSAPDDNRARLAAAVAACAYLRPHLDLGTGVFGNGLDWEAGADVRLVVPGQGCLLCLGGLDLAQRSTDWRRQRAGSLRSLNQVAIGQALALFERLVAGDLQDTSWMRLVLASDGRLSARSNPWVADPDCPLCGPSLGMGDAVLGSIPDVPA